MRVTEKLFRLLLRLHSANPDALMKINNFIRSTGSSFQLNMEDKDTDVSEEQYINSKNSIRGDYVKLLLDSTRKFKTKGQLVSHLIKDLYKTTKADKVLPPTIQELRDAELQNILTLFGCWEKITIMMSTEGELSTESIQQAIQQIELFEKTLQSLFGKDNEMEKWIVTPYIHQIICHYPQLLQKHRSIGMFQNQGFEASHNRMRSFLMKTAPAGKGSYDSSLISEDGEVTDIPDEILAQLKSKTILQLLVKLYAPLIPRINCCYRDTLSTPERLRNFVKFRNPVYIIETRTSAKKDSQPAPAPEQPQSEPSPSEQQPEIQDETSSVQPTPSSSQPIVPEIPSNEAHCYHVTRSLIRMDFIYAKNPVSRVSILDLSSEITTVTKSATETENKTSTNSQPQTSIDGRQFKYRWWIVDEKEIQRTRGNSWISGVLINVWMRLCLDKPGNENFEMLHSHFLFSAVNAPGTYNQRIPYDLFKLDILFIPIHLDG